jgi:hypothetical protein
LPPARSSQRPFGRYRLRPRADTAK